MSGDGGRGPRFEIVGEDWVADPRERALRVAAQLMDKPLTVALVVLAFGLAARGPGLLIEGYRPSGWFVLGMWICLSVLARLAVVGVVARFRAAFGIPAPRASAEGSE
jgi:hypothetical protein